MMCSLSDITNVKARGKYKSFFPKRLNIEIERFKYYVALTNITSDLTK